MCGLYLASSNNPRKMSSYTLTPNAYLMQESIQTLRFIRSEMIWIQIILIEMQIRRDMKRERYWLKFTNWHKFCHLVDSVPFFTSVRNSVFKCWIRSTAIPYVQQIKTCMKSFRFVPLSKHFCLEYSTILAALFTTKSFASIWRIRQTNTNLYKLIGIVNLMLPINAVLHGFLNPFNCSLGVSVSDIGPGLIIASI